MGLLFLIPFLLLFLSSPVTACDDMPQKTVPQVEAKLACFSKENAGFKETIKKSDEALKAAEARNSSSKNEIADLRETLKKRDEALKAAEARVVANQTPRRAPHITLKRLGPDTFPHAATCRDKGLNAIRARFSANPGFKPFSLGFTLWAFREDQSLLISCEPQFYTIVAASDAAYSSVMFDLVEALTADMTK